MVRISENEIISYFRCPMAMKSEQMLIQLTLIMSTFSLVSDGSVQRMVMEKNIIMKKMGTNHVGLCPMCHNPFKILEVQLPQHLNHLHECVLIIHERLRLKFTCTRAT